MPGDRAARRVARIRKWHELIERHGSDEAAHYAIRESPEWAMTYELYPSNVLDEGRRTLALDLMIDADKETGDGHEPLTVTSPTEQLDLGGDGYSKAELQVAHDLLAREGRLVARRLEDEGGMSWRRAHRFWGWHEAGAVRWDKERGLYPGPGFRWVKRKTRAGERFTLASIDG